MKRKLMTSVEWAENECRKSCGGRLAKVFEEKGYNVRSSDIIQRCEGVEEYDFFLLIT